MLKGNNFFQKVVVGLALVPLARGSGVAGTGATISEPWKIGRQISFLLIGGAQGTAATATCVVQIQKRSDSSWESMLDEAGNALTFTASKLADTAEIENGTILGTIDLSKVSATTHNAMRILYTRGAQAVNTDFGAAYIISDLYKTPSSQTDDLFSKTIPS